jgi:hypothetical protein
MLILTAINLPEKYYIFGIYKIRGQSYTLRPQTAREHDAPI